MWDIIAQRSTSILDNTLILDAILYCQYYMLNLAAQISTRNLYLFVAKNPRILPILVLVIVPVFIFASNLVHSIHLYYPSVPLPPRIIPSVIIPLISSKATLPLDHTQVKAEFNKIRLLPYNLVVLRATNGWTYEYFIQLTSIPFVILSLLYGFYPLKYHSEEYFK